MIFDPILFNPGGSKNRPLVGQRVNLAHPLGRNCVFAIPLTEGQWALNCPAVNGGFKPNIQYYSTKQTLIPTQGSSTTTTWVRSAIGWGLNLNGNTLSVGGATYDLIPTDKVTIVIIRRLRAAPAGGGLFGVNTTVEAENCAALVPYSDTIVYWDFGGFSGGHRLTWTGYTPTTNIEYWGFNAGPQGSAIWYNGSKKNSSSTAITRSASTSTGFALNRGNTFVGGDNQEIYFAAAFRDQWSDGQMRQWFADPFAMFYSVDEAFNYSILGASQGHGKSGNKGHKGGGGVNIAEAGGTVILNIGNPGVSIEAN